MPDKDKKNRKLKKISTMKSKDKIEKGNMANDIVKSLKPGLKADSKKIRSIKKQYKNK